MYSFILQRNIRARNQYVHLSPDACSSSTTRRQITSPASFVLMFYSQPGARDLWTTVRWPTGQRAATGSEVMTSGPMYGTNVALVIYADARRDCC